MIRPRHLAVAWFLMMPFSATGCSSDNTSIVATPPPPAGLRFERDPATVPVVSSGTAGWPIFPTDPGIIADSDGYHLFYCSYFCNAGGEYYYSWSAGDLGACNIMDVVTGIGYAFSDDSGRTWEFRGRPVLLPGEESWQCGDLETPHVAIVGDRLLLLYSATGIHSGEPFPQRYQVGAATLDLNGASIRQRLLVDDADFVARSEPLLPYDTGATNFDNNTQEPSVVVNDDGNLEVFYVGVGLSRADLPPEVPGQDIVSVGLARAVFTPDLEPLELPSGYLLAEANITEVKRFDGAYHVFATIGTAGEFHREERIVLYRSHDGVTFFGPFDLLLPEAEFDAWGLMAPTLVVEDDQLVMFYSGWSREDGPCFPEPFHAGIRFGRPSEGDTCIHGAIGRAVAVRP